MSEDSPMEPTEEPRLPRLYVDVAQVHIQPYSVHLLLGSNDVEGQPEAQVHITMSPGFAKHFNDALSKALKSLEESTKNDE